MWNGINGTESNKLFLCALEQYDDALSSGQQAFLLEETNESPDMFQLSVGILLPGGKASVSLDNVKDELKVESNCPLNYLNTEKTQATVSLAAGHQFDRDVELLLYYTHQPTAIVKAAQASAKPGDS
ncbi:von Willebrand factor A domain-containing protein 5A-like [Coregonus clupeaformis]|uniref:von Willebrand factor A domain-containing protein 5A-like n=1 Tax=Coregonus clupeaformis TaxID=59861 RepID=UPI001E1C4570|nr:von Willebrand factor A domain-containing protein 5A-like [Coregonus clupeaformis]